MPFSSYSLVQPLNDVSTLVGRIIAFFENHLYELDAIYRGSQNLCRMFL